MAQRRYAPIHTDPADVARLRAAGHALMTHVDPDLLCAFMRLANNGPPCPACDAALSPATPTPPTAAA
jgi:hypothetical protein